MSNGQRTRRSRGSHYATRRRRIAKAYTSHYKSEKRSEWMRSQSRREDWLIRQMTGLR
jgi:hypothetical protein